MYKGSCLCGTIRFEIKGAIYDIVCCHCTECRKAQGSAFATIDNVIANEFVILAGQNNLNGYKVSAL